MTSSLDRLKAMRQAPAAPPEPHEYIVGESGHTLKGVSIRTDKNGEESQRWTKTSRAGREDEDVFHIPDPKLISKTSALYDQDGRVIQQWITERPEAAAREALWREFAEALSQPLPRLDPIPVPPHALSSDHLAAYPIGDHHMGMLAWHRETGADYDLRIAEELLNRATDDLVGLVPPCDTALIAVLGDFYHRDSNESVTPTSRNLLDTDGRYPKMIEVGLRSLRRVIARCLERHGRVHVIVEIGNHDLATSVVLAIALANIYENEPRVTIDTSPMHFHYFEFGRCMIATHHGHGVKMAGLPLIMASDQPEMWGRTKHRYCWVGHVHHSSVMHQPVLIGKDVAAISVESFRILAPTDAWASQKGYRSIRNMKAVVMHREYGEIARYSVHPSMWT